jgi:hypothetical protein
MPFQAWVTESHQAMLRRTNPGKHWRKKLDVNCQEKS